MMTTEKNNNQLTEKIIGSAFKVSNQLGYGFLEKVYENALVIELKNNGIHVEQQKKINVFYEQILVGEYYADLLVEGQVIIELKSAKSIDDSHIAQILNYLKASYIKLGLIINFGKPRIEIRRIICEK